MQYNTTQEFTYLETEDYLALKTTATSGSLSISSWDGAQWVLSDTITTTRTKILFVKGERLQFVPSGDMVYSIKAGL